MMKSEVGILGLYQHIFQDMADALPALERELSKDYSSLRRLVETRGLRSLTIDLCAVAKNFDKCLASGKYKSPGLPLTKRISTTNQAPKFLGGLFLLVFDKDGSLKDCPSVLAISFIRQILLLCKKAAFPCAQADINREVKRLLEHDSSLPQPDSSWSVAEGEVHATGFVASHAERIRSVSDRNDRQEIRTVLGILDIVSGILTSTLGSFDPREWRFRHGPGAVSEGSRYSNKFVWDNWDSFLESEFPIADFGYYNYQSWCRESVRRSVGSSTLGEKPNASRLVAVPKTVDVPRLIAAEPSSAQWCQQNLLAYFVGRLQSSWLSSFILLDDQTYNQELCRQGSLAGDLCTIDLSAASDSVSCEFVGNLFRRNPPLLRALRAVRTRHLKQEYDKRLPEVTSLRKYSMMGSAVTFPVESIGFLAICLAGVLHSRGIRPNVRNIRNLAGEVSVFGDDLIIPKDSWDSVVNLLKANHFEVNANKSFREGNFRESCGLDAFKGESITPTYWRGPYTGDPESTLSLLELHNHLYSKMFLHAAAEVRKRLKVFPSVSPNSGAVGLHTRTAVVSTDPIRWCNAHQVWKMRVMTIQGRLSRRPLHSDCAVLQYFTESPSPFEKWKGGLQSRVRMSMRRRWVPLEGLLGG
jgi:hypothetical protein